MLRLDISEIGGGYVRRRFTCGGRVRYSGEKLTAEDLAAMPHRNREALIEMRSIDIYPKGDGGSQYSERHIVHRGCGKFDVIEGRKLNTEPLTKEQAEALAGTPEAPSHTNGEAHASLQTA